MKRFEGMNVVVTGAGSGIGAACVDRLVAEGATVVAVDLSQEAIEKLHATYGTDKVKGVALDVCDNAAAIAVLAEKRKELGSLRGIINCAGIAGTGGIADVDLDVYRRAMAVNVDGTINMCQAYVRAVQDDEGDRSIVNFSSAAGILGVPNRVPYVAAKFAVSGISKSMSPELGPLGIRVNAIAPGMTKTPFIDYMLKEEGAEERFNAKHPIGRLADPSEIAAVAVFLLTDDASFMTGSVVSVDGGQTACI
ncbi:SDR family NAD(P)-dependent oxidoreductase [Celeribacter naphthalenivorans]|uniref:SDR family NAD(P)-dependent oxidoreductase n=1 Tax=Celeribacter naphthalenivorans TaxID=1614694 RepID=UPI001CFB0CC0|nr:SDR family oxidoreductase [Celeribacter naphthalenivorans]